MTHDEEVGPVAKKTKAVAVIVGAIVGGVVGYSTHLNDAPIQHGTGGFIAGALISWFLWHLITSLIEN